MKITVWPDNNLYFHYGIDVFIENHKKSVKKYPWLVFIDLSGYNLKDILRGNFFDFSSKGATIVFICEEKLLPLGLYYKEIIKKSYLFSARENTEYIVQKIGSRDYDHMVNPFRVLSGDEYLLLRMMFIEHKSIKLIASELGVSNKTVYSRAESISKKIQIKNIKYLCIRDS